MKKFEEELFSEVPCKFGLSTEGEYKQSILVKHFGDWISPEDHQAEVWKIELQNLKYREELARMQKSLRKKNKAIKELNGAVKKTKARLKECEKLRIEANNEAASEYSRKCEVVEERAEFKREIEKLKSQLEKQQPEIPEFVANYIEAAKEDFWTLLSAMDDSNLSSRVGDWLKGGNFTNQEIFAQAWLNGYTVAKEKRFYLKDNRELESVGDTCIGYVTLYLKNDGYLTTNKTRAGQFTQSEIDSMAADSYEQIEVEE
ncbi:hypothetical protein C426_1970 [Lactococcus garvieae DCC43]|uniref:Phage protein n=2 Tax=Lactococcus garvieae TaxID=1363 RepID=K2PGZ8_9LACT|nr:hypothetical protein C426_1970 [Lactococcus garvieae DCC43]